MKLIIFSLLTTSLYATAITSNGTGGGNWATGATWIGGVAPGGSDNAILANGDTVTVPVSTSVTVNGIACVSSSGTGKLTVNGHLTYTANVQQCSVLTLGPGAHLTGGSGITWLSYFSGSSVNATTVLLGASGSGNHITWDSVGGAGVPTGGIGATNNSGVDGGLFTGGWIDFKDIGATDADGILVTLHSANTIFACNYCTFTRCARVDLGEMSSTANFSLTNSNITNPNVSSSNSFRTLELGSAAVATYSTGVRQIVGNYLEGATYLQFNNAGTDPSFFVHNNVFYQAVAGSAAAAPAVETASAGVIFSGNNWANNIVWKQVASGNSYSSTIYWPCGNMSRTYNLYGTHETPATANMHMAFTSPCTTTFDTNLWEASDSGDGAQAVQTVGSTVAPLNLSFKNGIYVPGLDGTFGPSINHSWITACNQTSVWCPIITYQNNTSVNKFCGSNPGCGVSGEGTSGPPGMIPVAEDNIFWSGSSVAGSTVWPWAGMSSAGVTTADYNWIWNLTGDYYELGTMAAKYSTTPGTHDTVGTNPQFVDSSRNFLKWCQTINAADTTWGDCLAHWQLIGTDTFDARYNVSSLIDYVRAGYQPLAPSAATASSVGKFVGAVAPTVSESPVLFYTDLVSGPASGGEGGEGVFVTVTGKGFGMTQGGSTLTLGGGATTVKSWSDSKIVFQPGPSGVTGNIVVTVSSVASNTLPFTVRSGNIRCVSNTGTDSGAGTFTGGGSSCWATMNFSGAHLAAGDILMVGKTATDTYQSEDRTLSCVSDTAFRLNASCGIVTGTSVNPISVVGYPGALATIGGVGGSYGQYGIWGDATHAIGWWNFSNLRIIAGSWNGFIDQGYGAWGITTEGVTGLRVVNCDIQNPVAYFGGALNVVKTLATTSSGTVTWLLGNYLHNVAIPIITGFDTKHIAMIYVGSDGNEVEVGWNLIDDGDVSAPANRCFHVHSSPFNVGQQTDGFRIYGLLVHDNVIQNCGGNGIDTTIDPSEGTGVHIYNNIWNNVSNCPNWEGSESSYAVFYFGESGSSADFNWTPGSGIAYISNNTINNSGYCPTFPTAAMVFEGATYWDGAAGELQPPPRVTICASSCFGTSYSGTLPATMYAPNNYFANTVTFISFEGTGSTASQAIIDDGAGNLLQEGTTVGTIVYTTGVYSFTFLRTPINPSIYYQTTSGFRISFANNIVNLNNANQAYFQYNYDLAGLYMFQGNNNLFRSITYSSPPAQPLAFTSNVGSNANPQFVNANPSPFTDLHLQSISPAINAGVTLNPPTRDLDGRIRPQGTSYTLGAYEPTTMAPPATPSTAAAVSGKILVNRQVRK